MNANPDEPPNPYQPPGHETPDTLEQKYAKRLLTFRDRPVTIGSVYRGEGTPKRVAIVFIYYGLAIAFFVWVSLYALAFLMLGILVGSLANGFGLVRKSVKFWAGSKATYRLGQVEKMARGELLDVRLTPQ